MRGSTEIPNDPVLQHLGTLLDAERMAPILMGSMAMAGGDFEAQSCRIERVKYKPGRSCLISYRLEGCDKNGRDIVERITARSYEPGGSASRYAKALRRLTRPGTGQPITHIPALDLVLWTFPHERKMTNLQTLTAEAAAPASALGRALESRYGPGAFHPHEQSLIHYAPEHTCCVRLQGTWNNGVDRSLTLYGKAYEDDRGAGTAEVMRQLDAMRGRGHQAPRTPCLILDDSEQRILWQEGLPGKPLADALSDVAALEHTARALVGLHRSLILCRRRIETPTRLDQLDRVLDLAKVIGAKDAPRLSAVVDRLKASAPSDSAGPIATLHGDFHAKNVLINQDEAALIDLDNVAIGAPLHDVGSFVASLIHATLTDGHAPSAIMPTIDVFLDAYRQAATWTVSDDALAWHTATALIEQRVYRTITRLKPGRLGLIGPLIDATEQLLSTGVPTTGCRRSAAR